MLERVDCWMLVFTTPRDGRYVNVRHQAGNLYFTERVHRRARAFAIECVDRLELQDTSIVIGRGSDRHPDGDMRGKAVFPPGDYPMGVFYSWKIRANDTEVMLHEISGTVKEISVIEITILHELLHIRYPEADEDWVFDKAYDILFNGWEVIL